MKKAGRPDLRTQQCAEMRKVLLTQEKEGPEEIPQSETAEKLNTEKADTKMRKMRLPGFIVIGFR